MGGGVWGGGGEGSGEVCGGEGSALFTVLTFQHVCVDDR